VVDRAIRLSIPGSLPEPERLRTSIQQVLEAYASEDVRAYLELMQTQGIDPIARIAQDPQAAQGYWDATRSLLATATVDTEALTVLHTIQAGQQQYPADPPPVLSVRRDDARPFLASLDRSRLEVAELRIPGTFKGQQGTAFEGDMCIEFTFDPGKKTWVLTAFRISGMPNGVSVMLPPI